MHRYTILYYNIVVSNNDIVVRTYNIAYMWNHIWYPISMIICPKYDIPGPNKDLSGCGGCYQNEYQATLRCQQCPVHWGLIVTLPARFPLEIHALLWSLHTMTWQHASVFHYSWDVASWILTLTQGKSTRTRRIPPALDTKQSSLS